MLPDWRGTIIIERDEGYDGPIEYSFANERGIFEGDTRAIARVDGLTFDQPGFHFLTIRDPSSGVSGVSNPILVCGKEPAERLFWGDLHCHTIFSDGIRCPEDYIHSQRTNPSSIYSHYPVMLRAKLIGSGTTS